MRTRGKANDYAVVLGTDVNGLGHIRALGREGVAVFGVFSAKDDESLGRCSRYCIPLQCRADKSSRAQLLECVVALSKGLPEKPVLFATSDYFVDFMSEHREVLENYCYFNLPGAEILRTISNKRLVGKAAAKFGVRYPETYELESPEVLKRLSHSLKYPCIIKPDDSYSVDFPGKTHIARDREALMSFFGLHPHLIDKVLVQQVVPGKETGIVQCTGYIDARGNALQFCTVQKIHQFPPNYGIMTYGRTQHLPVLVESTVAFLKSMGYTGFVSAEYKLNEQDGEYCLIEMNPRLPWYNALFASAGVNLPMIYFLDHRRPAETSSYCRRQRDDVSWMYFRNELAGMLKRRSAGERIGLFGFVRAILRTRSFAYWSPSDPMPFVQSILAFVKWGAEKLLAGAGAHGRSD